MTKLFPPAGWAGLKKFTLESGNTYATAEDGSVTVTDLTDIAELVGESWGPVNYLYTHDLKKGSKMPTTFTDADVLDLARKFAAEAADRDGNEFWTVRDVHLDAARQQLAAKHAPPITKSTDTIEDRALRAAAEHAGLQQRSMHEGMSKSSLLATHTYLDASHSRVTFGDVSTEHGIIQVSIDRGTTMLNLHGHDHAMGDIAYNTRMAIFCAAAAFIEAETQEEQARQRVVIGALIEAAMSKDHELSRKVRAEIERARH